MRILHGMTEVAGQGYYSVKGLCENKHKADMAVLISNPLGYPNDFVLNVDRNKFRLPMHLYKIINFYRNVCDSYDVFHFHFARTLLPFGIDLKRLRKKKKVFIEFHGSELRWRFNRKPEDKNSYAYIHGIPNVSKFNQAKIQYLCNNCDGIVLHDCELLPHLPVTKTPVFFLPLRIDINRFAPNYPVLDKDEVVIVHAPSKRAIKGTEYITEAVEKLSQKYRIKYILIENMTNDEAIKVYSEADIIVDQLFIGTYGVFACEAMALGKPVITYISDDMMKNFPEQLPIVSSSIYRIEKTLEEMIQDGEKRRALGLEGRKYVENYHDYRKVASLAEKIYNGENTFCTHLEAFEEVRKVIIK